MVANIKCLCTSCSKNCSSCAKTSLALSGNMTYIYLRNGDKLTNSCKCYLMAKSMQTVSPSGISVLNRLKPAINLSI